MSVFKTFFAIVKNNKMSFILAITINLGITFAYVMTNQSENSNNFKAEKSKIAVINKDNGLVGQQLEDYLKEQTTIVSIDTSEKGQQDALFFKEVMYILTIPTDFSEMVANGKVPKLPTKSVPNSQADFQTSSLINQYINKVAFYTKNFPEKNEKEILSMVAANLANKAEVTFEANETKADTKDMTARIFNLLAYGLFMTILSSIGLVSISMNRKNIKDRNNCSPLSERKRSYFFSLAVIIFSILSWTVFVGISLGLSKSRLSDSMTQLMLLNSAVFLLTMISLSVIVSYFVTSTEMIAGLNNILILGTCFISGAFVPQEFLSAPVLKIASFFPTYWFIANNNLLANIEVYSMKTLKEFYFNIGILVLFSLVFTLISFIIRREHGEIKKKGRALKNA